VTIAFLPAKRWTFHPGAAPGPYTHVMNGLAFLGLVLAVVALVLVRLNARDRRRAGAIAAVVGACPAALRGSIAVHARGSLLSRGVVLELDVSACDDGDVWPAVRLLAAARPRRVTLVVAARLDATVPVAVQLPARGGGYPATLTMPACGASGTR
jgi:hypothetical protein